MTATTLNIDIYNGLKTSMISLCYSSQLKCNLIVFEKLHHIPAVLITTFYTTNKKFSLKMTLKFNKVQQTVLNFLEIF